MINNNHNSDYSNNRYKRKVEEPCYLGVRSSMEEVSSCPHKASYMDNWKQMYKDRPWWQNIGKTIVEMKEVLTEPNYLVETPFLELDDFEDNFMNLMVNTHREKHFKSYVNRVFKSLRTTCQQQTGNPNYLHEISHPSFVLAVLEQLGGKKIHDKSRTILISLIKFFFNTLGAPKTEPIVLQLTNIITFYNRAFKTNCVKQNKPLHPYLLMFIESLKEHDLSHKLHQDKISTFLRYVVDKERVTVPNWTEVPIDEISEVIIADFRSELERKIESQKMGVDAAQHYVKCLKQWFDFLLDKNLIASNPTKRLKRFKTTRTNNYPTLQLSEVREFFRAIICHSKNLWRDLAFFSLVGTVGLRESEALSLKISDITDFSVKVKRKGGETEKIPVPGIFLLAVEMYLKTRCDHSDALWLNSRGRNLLAGSVRRDFKKYMKLAGISTYIPGPHFFRHHLFTQLCIAGEDLETIRLLAGHKNLKQLDDYIGLSYQQVLSKFTKTYQAIGSDIYFQSNNP